MKGDAWPIRGTSVQDGKRNPEERVSVKKLANTKLKTIPVSIKKYRNGT
jgi:hypothetical protein